MSAKRLVRLVGIGLACIVGLALVGYGALYWLGERALARRFPLASDSLEIPTDSAAVERGQHIATAISKCTLCHGDDLGGKLFIDGMPFGRFVAPNLTRGKGSVVSGWSDVDWLRAVRHSVTPEGRGLVFMPSSVWTHLSPRDLGAVVAYAKQVPPVDRELPKTALGPIGRLVLATHSADLMEAERVGSASPLPPDPVIGPTAEYGSYLVVVGGCTTCHGDDLAGGIKSGPPGTPASANLTPEGVGTWTEADFLKALRTGVRPDGSAINPFMPWSLTRLMTDDEIWAVWAYLKTVPAKQPG